MFMNRKNNIEMHKHMPGIKNTIFLNLSPNFVSAMYCFCNEGGKQTSSVLGGANADFHPPMNRGALDSVRGAFFRCTLIACLDTPSNQQLPLQLLSH